MDTFYLDLPKGGPDAASPPHTSPVQIPPWEKRQPPVRVMCPARSTVATIPTLPILGSPNRRDWLSTRTSPSAIHRHHRIFVKQFFGKSVKRVSGPSLFSVHGTVVEFDVSCIFCGGQRHLSLRRNCGKSRLRLDRTLGAGMSIPPFTLRHYDAKEKLAGFAFAWAMDRLDHAQVRHRCIQVSFRMTVRF